MPVLLCDGGGLQKLALVSSHLGNSEGDVSVSGPSGAGVPLNLSHCKSFFPPSPPHVCEQDIASPARRPLASMSSTCWKEKNRSACFLLFVAVVTKYLRRSNVRGEKVYLGSQLKKKNSPRWGKEYRGVRWLVTWHLQRSREMNTVGQLIFPQFLQPATTSHLRRQRSGWVFLLPLKL